MKTVQEKWKAIPGYKGFYEVSNLGNVRSIARKFVRKDGKGYTTKSRVLKASRCSAGYLGVGLHKGSEQKTMLVHRLVASAFISMIPKGMCVCHNDGNKLNNCVDNLRIDTPSGNQLDRRKHETCPRREQNPNSKLVGRDVDSIRGLLDKNVPSKEIAERFGVHKSTISDIKTGKTWK